MLHVVCTAVEITVSDNNGSTTVIDLVDENEPVNTKLLEGTKLTLKALSISKQVDGITILLTSSTAPDDGVRSLR